MAACPACGAENPEGFAFCGFCSASMVAEPSVESEERKVVSVLFCDLVGFTAASEQVDPEDVRASLRPYHSLLRTEIEAYGGTVEKFIGDAVMAVFGAPIAHEDDAERAVRAALRILESLEELNEERGLELAVRIGINTGEAVVTLGARPEQGEGFVTGDVVNTAARIQTGAPVGGVAVGATTYASTKDVIVFEELEPIVGKGKALPIAAWRALEARARFGTDVTRRHDTVLVGRDTERTLLSTLLEKSIRDASCQLVTIMGEPGVGKSRMVYELQELVDARPELIRWRQGRCLPYGDGITFWALGEIVKAEAGILESDDPDQAISKLDRVLRARAFALEDTEWFRARLAPLIGVEAPSSADREESFTAWRRFLEGVAGSDPAVFVFEDLHWADAALLAFLEHLADWSEGSPMLVVCTARPELTEQHVSWSRGLRNAAVIGLSPLSEADTGRLVSSLLDQPAMPAEIQAPIVERSGGNPLYAEEFVRMLKDRGLLVAGTRGWSWSEGPDFPFPENIQGLIAARLDTLAPDRKALLQDAAVLGKVFWTGALCVMGGRRPDDVEAALHELSRKEFIRASRTSSMEGEREHGFWHMLVRDVAYGQIPRGARASKHVAAAEWIEERAGDRVEDLADVLAHHYVEALDLTSAAGGDVAATTERAISFLGLAARRSAGLDPTRSAGLYERALSLMPEGHPDRPSLEHRLGEVMKALLRFDDALECFERASNGYRELGNEVAAADAQVSAIEARAYVTASAIDRVRLAEVISVLEAAPPGPELVRAYSTWARWDYTEGSPGDGVGWADKTLATGAALGLADDASALQVRGAVRFLAGDAAGLTDLRRSESLARERGDARGLGVVHNSIALVLAVSEGPGAALTELDGGIDRLRSAGHEALADSLGSSTRLEVLYDLGRWEEITQIAEAGLAAPSSTRHPMKEMAMRFVLGHVLMWRGDPAQAASVTDGLLAMALDFRETDTLLPTLDVLAHIAIGTGEPQRCRELLHEIEAHPTLRECWNYLAYLPEIVRLALAVGDMDLARKLGASIPPATLDLHRIALEMVAAQLAEAGGDHDEAAKRYDAAERGWRTFSVPELAQALLGRGRCLVALNDPDAVSTFRDARDVFASLDARRYLPEVDGLLERAMRQSS